MVALPCRFRYSRSLSGGYWESVQLSLLVLFNASAGAFFFVDQLQRISHSADDTGLLERNRHKGIRW